MAHIRWSHVPLYQCTMYDSVMGGYIALIECITAHLQCCTVALRVTELHWYVALHCCIVDLHCYVTMHCNVLCCTVALWLTT